MAAWINILSIIAGLAGWYGWHSLPVLIVCSVLILICSVISCIATESPDLLGIIVVIMGCLVSIFVEEPWYVCGMLTLHFYSAALAVIGLITVIAAAVKKKK